MKKYNKIKSFFLMVLIALGMTSCLNDLNIQPIDPSIIQTFKQDEVFAKVYASWAVTGQNVTGESDITLNAGEDEGRTALYRIIWNLNELPTDNAHCAWGDAEIVKLQENLFTTDNALIKYGYSRLFIGIVTANHFLAATEAKTDEATLKQRAEVRFLRALSYSYLIDLYGNVPFVDKITADAPLQMPRAELFNWLEEELLDLEPDLFEPKQAPYYRVDKAAAWMLLARLYLNAEVYTGTARWNDAAVFAKRVIDSSYGLASEYKYLFMADNAGAIDGSAVNDADEEIIFPIAQDGIETRNWGGSTFLVSATRTSGMPDWGTVEAWGGNRARLTLMRKFFPAGDIPSSADLTVEAADDRAMFYSIDRKQSITAPTTFEEGISIVKFSNIRADGKSVKDTKHPDTDIPMIRKAEAYLIYAEALVNGASSIGGLDALAAVNELRKRANASLLVAVNKDVILDEWAREFYFEGRRRTDLIRNGYFTGNVYNWDWKGGTPTGTPTPAYTVLYPIPTEDLNANPNLEQNEGYKTN